MAFLAVPSVFTALVIVLVTIVLLKIIAALYKQQTYWKHKNVLYLKSNPVLGVGWKFFARRMTIAELGEAIYYSYPNARYVANMDRTLPVITLRDPELIREVAVKNFDHFMDHKVFFQESNNPLFMKNVFALRGERWREMRSILSPSFTGSKMKFMFELISKCSQDFVDYLYAHPEYSSSFELKDAFTKYTNDVIATSAFGISVNSMENPENEFFTNGRNVFSSIMNNVPKLLLLSTFPRLAKALGLRLIPSDITYFFSKIISETLKVREEQGIVRPDMLHLLMQARDTEKHQMTVEDIVSQAFIFFLAGFETSANLMCFFLYELALNPDIQEKLREEVDRSMDEGNGTISYDILMKMEYMEMVTSETLRKYPALIIIDRVCTKEYEFPPAEDGYNSATMYPDSLIHLPVYALQHDPKYFPDPEKFDPERFRDPSKITPYTYFPFGIGPRKCIGDRFALMETKIVIAHLLHRFVVKRIEKTQVPLVFKKWTMNLAPEKGFWVGLEKRFA
ncbi:cytochrome P450 9e2-like [Ceratina calcarata]|uniref:Cytochrome P450 9e2-like n=1 Tax=Ceratina calcarata TaxID=156304 RepID=A0AAJ7J950_9HYME|nr:cytochrome P450 9e2-like [Ceratina calcarata]